MCVFPVCDSLSENILSQSFPACVCVCPCVWVSGVCLCAEALPRFYMCASFVCNLRVHVALLLGVGGVDMYPGVSFWVCLCLCVPEEGISKGVCECVCVCGVGV